MEKVPQLTKKDFKEMEAEKKRNSKERMEFIDMYAKWLKKTPNKIWSKQQKEFLDK